MLKFNTVQEDLDDTLVKQEIYIFWKEEPDFYVF